jgi:hypothetical protein
MGVGESKYRHGGHKQRVWLTPPDWEGFPSGSNCGQSCPSKSVIKGILEELIIPAIGAHIYGLGCLRPHL